MNLVDVAVLVLAGLAAFRGWRRGFLGQLFEFGGGLLGLIAGVALGGRVARTFADDAGPEAALISIATVFVMLSIGQAVGFVAGHRFGLFAQRARLGGFDAALGAALSVVVTFVAFWLIGGLLIHGPSKSLAKALQRSETLALMNDSMPPPPDVLAYIRQYLDTSGFPQVFSGLPRPVGPPVELPSNARASRAARKAEASMVRIVVPACGGTQLGSGWVAAPERVVTNAHVVSGGDTVTVQDAGGDHTGTVVVFDPKTDVAVLHVEGLSGPPLELQTAEQERGTGGATLGYPGSRDGTLVVKRAAVQDRYSATGKDIYGRADATRDVYELRAPVRQGDSGGPFVLPGGAVAGVVFAASTTDANIGYALTAQEVQDEIERGAGRTQPVGTGRCTH
ncbi:MAG TPA: MarP family serine protease [Actinomycetota bacterium]|nr:MarP family serine protease [Actinomycetota bacterium]